MSALSDCEVVRTILLAPDHARAAGFRARRPENGPGTPDFDG